MLFLHYAAVELVAFDLLGLEDRVAPGLEGGEALVQQAGGAAVEPQRRFGKILQEAPVMADQNDCRAHGLEHRLQALDGDDIEMVGGLVEQENVGLRRQYASESRTAAFASRQMRWVLLAGEAETLKQIACAVRIIAKRKPGLDEGRRGGEAGQVWALRQIADRHRGLHEARAGIRLDHPRGDLEHSRLARTVAAHQTPPLERSDRKLRAGKQGRTAETEPDVFEKEERRRHGLAVPSAAHATRHVGFASKLASCRCGGAWAWT
jgi:hypothetical protein